jgi:hypothetical protein
VEDWAEIRRLHRAEGLPIRMIVRVFGGVAEHGAGGVGFGCSAAVPAQAVGVGCGCGGAADP